MKAEKILVGAGFVAGASVGLVLFAVKTTAKAALDVTKNVALAPKKLVDKIRLQDLLHKKEVLLHEKDRLLHKKAQAPKAAGKPKSGPESDMTAQPAQSVAQPSESKANDSKSQAQAQQKPLTVSKAQELADALSVKPSINEELQNHPYSPTLKNPEGFRPTGASGSAV